MPLDGGFLHNLIKELQCTALDTRVDKVFVPSLDEVVLNLRGFGTSHKLLLSARNSAARVGFTENPPENPKTAPMLCMLLRKYLGGAKLCEISGVGLERVVKLGFEARNELGDLIYPSLYIELITGSCNIIFVDTDGKIVDCIRRSDIEKNTRLIAPGARYALPEGHGKQNPLECGADDLADRIAEEKGKRIWKAMLDAIDGISPLVARELALSVSPDLDTPIEEAKSRQLRWAAEKLQSALNMGEAYLICNPDGKPYDFSFMPIVQYGSAKVCRKIDSFSALLDEFYQKRDNAERIRRQSQDILKLLSTLSGRVGRKLEARRRDLEKCEKKEDYRIFGELIKANIYAISRGDSVAEVVNYYDPEGATVKIPLNVTLSPADNAQKYFKEYKKLCVAEKTLQELLDEAEKELRYIDSCFDLLTRAETSAELEAIREELVREGYLRRRAGTKPQKLRPAPLQFTTTAGLRVLVGRNNTENDELTLKTAAKSDIWFHTKGIHGSHTVLFCEGREPDEQSVVEAATLAAWHSKGRHSSSVAVDYTPAKFVKKPSGAKPGMVIYNTNKTVFVTPDEETVNRLKGGGQS